MTRWAIATLLLVPALAFGQTRDDDSSRVSNDQPGRPLQMSPASTEVKEAIDDFERFRRRGAWERALKALDTIPEEQAVRFVDGENGFIIPVARKRRALLTALPPEGQAAFRLFYDAQAQKLYEGAEGPSERKTLERIVSSYFITSIGDNAADRLGDLYYELGHFDRAADSWLAVVRDRPDTELSPALLSLKAALALLRSGRRSEFEQVRAELADRYRDEKLTIGGVTASPTEHLRRLMDDLSPAGDVGRVPVQPAGPAPDLTRPVEPVWQMRFADSVVAGMTSPELSQWQANPLSAAVPAVTDDGTTLYANYLGHVFAIDLQTGKMRWRSGPLHHIKLSAIQGQFRSVDASRYAIVTAGDRLWTLGRDLKEQNVFAPFQLTCRRAEGGEVVWQSADLSDYAQIDLVGMPLLAGGRLFIAGKSRANPQQQERQPQQLVLAVQPEDGKVLWKTEVGTFREGQQVYYYNGMMNESTRPQLVYRARVLYIDTHVGILARLDADSGALDWGFGYPTDPVAGQGRFFMGGYMTPQEGASASSPPVPNGESLLIKGMQCGRLYALDPDRMKVQWDRAIARSSRLLGASDRALFLGGPELSALDLRTRQLLWATRLPSGSAERRVLVRPDGLWQLTPRGIFEIDPASGTVRRIFRGKDLGTEGGDLFLTGRWLLAVSNRTISAYPRQAPGAAVSVDERSATTLKRASND